jgi:mycothiol system anti-sigma-R factor
MATCREVEHLVTQYLDGEASPPDRARVDAHLATCPLCRQRAEAESSAREVLRARCKTLNRTSAPAGLHSRCAAELRASTVTGWIPASWQARALPMAVAATVILAAGGLAFWLSDRSATLLAAQLTTDHVRCFEYVGVPVNIEPRKIEASLADRYGWQMRVPPGSSQEGLQLLSVRRCNYSDGDVAHLMYRHQGRDVSLFVVPKKREAFHEIKVMGHEALVWSQGGQTYLLVARETRPELEHLASYVRTCTK